VPEHLDAVIGWQLVMDVFGSANRTFVERMPRQLFSATDKRFPEAELELNDLMSIVQALKPRDEAEAMLATYITVTQSGMMRFASVLAQENRPMALEMYERMYNRTARTLAVQFDALKRYRTGGEQKITVQHVQNAAVKGQAIVGNVTHTSCNTAADPDTSSPLAAESTSAPQGGAPGSGAPRGNRNALKSGLYTREALEGRRRLREFLRQGAITNQRRSGIACPSPCAQSDR
jgi:hypothetical protein